MLKYFRHSVAEGQDKHYDPQEDPDNWRGSTKFSYKWKTHHTTQPVHIPTLFATQDPKGLELQSSEEYVEFCCAWQRI